MRYEQPLFRPPSEANSYIAQAAIGCSWNHCTYCGMYRSKPFRVRELAESLADVREAGQRLGRRVDKVFVADGDALVLSMDHWLPLLAAIRDSFPRLRQVSCYATARNVLDKSDAELRLLLEAGLALLYIGPESGDDATLKAIAKGASFDQHAEAARRARAAGFKQSVIFLLGAAGVERSQEHAEGSANLVTAMDPDYLAALTVTVVPGTPLAELVDTGRFSLPDPLGMLRELRTLVDLARPTDAVFRTNHASNYLPLRGSLPADRESMLRALDAALDGQVRLRPEWSRGL